MAINGIGNLLIREPSRHVKIEGGHSPMAANENFLVYFANQFLIVIDRDGNETLRVDRLIDPYDICWSSYLNRFLITGSTRRDSLYVLDPTVAIEAIQAPELNHKFRKCITCYDKTCLVLGRSAVIEEYELPSWALIRAFSRPQSCKATQNISQIRFNSNGSHVGVVIIERIPGTTDFRFSLELRSPNDMVVLKTVQMGTHFFAISWLLALPNEKFLVNTFNTRKLYLIGSNGQLNEEIDYYQNEQSMIRSTALLNGQHLVVKTSSPDLRFYDL